MKKLTILFLCIACLSSTVLASADFGFGVVLTTNTITDFGIGTPISINEIQDSSPPVINSCSYVSGDWFLPCGCNVSSAVNVTGNVILNGTGEVKVDAPIEFYNLTIPNTCNLTMNGSGQLLMRSNS